MIKRIARRVMQIANAESRNRRRILRQLAKLSSKSRYSAGSSSLLGPPFVFNDAATFAGNYRDIFLRHIYRFPSTTETPLVIDCGANTGLGVLYAKREYPGAKVIAFEADPKVAELLVKNVAAFNLSDVHIETRAVWTEVTHVDFYREGADSGRVGVPIPGGEHIQVRTARLRDYLNTPVDFLKIDIEGAETDVLEDCADRLCNVKSAFVEFHSFASKPQALARLVACLETAGFRLIIESVAEAGVAPLCTAGKQGMDLQLNVFAFRRDHAHVET